MRKASQNRKIIRAIAYAIESQIPDEENFFEILEDIGYEVKKKPLKEYYGGAKKGDWDLGIAIDALKMADKLDVVCLVTGDFKHLVEHLQANGVRVEVLAFEKSTSNELIRSANNFIDMGKDKKTFLMG